MVTNAKIESRIKISNQLSCETANAARPGASVIPNAKPVAKYLIPINLSGLGGIKLTRTRPVVINAAPPNPMMILPKRNWLNDKLVAQIRAPAMKNDNEAITKYRQPIRSTNQYCFEIVNIAVPA